MKSLIVFFALSLFPTVEVNAQSKKPRGGDVGMIILSEPTAATTTGRPAWQWSIEERIAARCNPAAAQARAKGSPVSAMAVGGLQTAYADVISGKTNPELFLPTELFEAVVRGAFLVEGWREVYAKDMAKAGLPVDFVTSLKLISASYLPLLREQQQIRTRRSGMGPGDHAVAVARLAALDIDMCRARYAALTATRARFGIALDRFLYGPVARSRVMYFDDLSNAAALTAREKGCR
jgi:hypothetical protein